MRRIRSMRLGLLAAGLLAVLARPAAAQQQKTEDPQAVTIVTADFVELKAHFYPSSKGANAPAVMLLHALNEDSKKDGWIKLARTLQKAGYAVLRFDFRGCGDSTTVKPGVPHFNPQLRKKGFWDEAENRNFIKGSMKRPATIDVKQFLSGYYPILINDIAAAKAWLDTAPCNANNLTLIGAREGATLGAVWLNAEWNRYRLVPDPKLMREVPDYENPEGQAVTAAIWLSLTPRLGNGSLTLSSLLYKPAVEQKVPMLFFSSKGDTAGRKTAQALEKAFKGAKGKKSNASPSTGAGEVDAEKLTGSALLSVPGVSESLTKWLGSTEKEKTVRKSEAGPQDPYVWVLPNRVLRPARIRGNLLFFNFSPFLR
jgi:hypothetical protein